MRRLLPTILVLLLSSICAGPLRADGVVPPQLSLTDAVSLALKMNVSVKASEESRRAAESRLRIANIGTSFTMGSFANLDRTKDDSNLVSSLSTGLDYAGIYGTEASLDLSPYGSGGQHGSLSLTLRHPLMSGRGLLSDRADIILAARADASIVDREFYLDRQSTVLDVVDAYYGAVLAKEQVKVQESAVATAEKVADGTKKREAEGLVAGIEVSRAEINVAQTRDALNLQRQKARGAMDALMLAIGVGIGQTTELVSAVPETLPEIPTLDEAVSRALANRAELANYEDRLAEQKRRLDIASDELRPGLDLVAGFDSSEERTGLISDSVLGLGHLTTGVELRFPLDRRISEERRDTAARSLSLMQEQRAFQKEQISEQVRSAYRSFDAAKLSLEIYSQNLDVAKDRLHIAERMVEEGEGSNREVLDAQESLTITESGLLSAKIDLYLACIDVKHAMGEDLTVMELK